MKQTNHENNDSKYTMTMMMQMLSRLLMTMQKNIPIPYFAVECYWIKQKTQNGNAISCRMLLLTNPCLSECVLTWKERGILKLLLNRSLKKCLDLLIVWWSDTGKVGSDHGWLQLLTDFQQFRISDRNSIHLYKMLYITHVFTIMIFPGITIHLFI